MYWGRFWKERFQQWAKYGLRGEFAVHVVYPDRYNVPEMTMRCGFKVC